MVDATKSKFEEFKEGVLGLALIGAIGFGVWHFFIRAESAETVGDAQAVEATAPEQTVDPAEAARRKAEIEHERTYGQHCLSGWDGSHREFVESVKRQLNDPDSFEHDETRTWTVREDGRNPITMQFRAKNGFGGVIRGRAVGTFDNKTCEPLVDSVE